MAGRGYPYRLLAELQDAKREVAGWPGVTAIWAMNEPLGASVLTAYPDTAFNGTINGPTMGIPSGIAGIGTGGESDGLVDYYANYSAALAAAFNPNLNWFISVQSMAAGEWATATQRYVFQIGADSSNRWFTYKSAAGQIQIGSLFGGSFKAFAKNGLTTVNPFSIGGQINKAGTGFSAWMNNAAVGASQAITGTWAGSLVNTFTGLGNYRSSSYFLGWKGPMYFAACGNGYDVSDLMIPFANKYGLTEAL